MVSSLKSGPTNAQKSRLSWGQFLFPVGSKDAVTLDQIELDFSDVFGPAPIQLSVEVNENAEASDLVYDDPVVVYSRSHSLVGPSSYVNQSLKLSMLALCESENLVEFVECVSEEDCTKSLVLSRNDEKSSNSPEENLLGVQVVGIDDFEILKVVGQGAFGKVFQVRKKGTSDVYAMKVMRKDKIMEKNHAEYMKAERDILTKVHHPFIVQLRYSFQVGCRCLWICLCKFPQAVKVTRSISPCRRSIGCISCWTSLTGATYSFSSIIKDFSGHSCTLALFLKQ